jgi:hypothetical protein
MKVKDSKRLYLEDIAKYEEQLLVNSSRKSNKLTNNICNICVNTQKKMLTPQSLPISESAATQFSLSISESAAT